MLVVAPMTTIEDRIRTQYSQLSPQERKLADFILNNPTDLAIFNSAELARICKTSKATVSRLFKRLGFASFKEGKDTLRQQRQLGVPVLEEAGNVQQRDYTPHFEQEIKNLQLLQQSLSKETLNGMVEGLDSARTIKVIGFRNSYPVALHIRQQLIQMRPNVDIAPMPGQTLGEELQGLDENDVVIFIAFRRRPKMYERILKLLFQSKTPVLLIADPSLRRFAKKAAWWVECPIESVSGFNTYSAAMSFATLLCNSVLHHRASSGQQRIMQISELYTELDEIDYL
jgi:DNA-binding MurR/RpiR family transcriptional regulator